MKDRFVRAFVGLENCHYPTKTELPKGKSTWPTYVRGKNPLAVQGILRGTEDEIQYYKENNLTWFYLDHAYFQPNREYMGPDDTLLYRINYCSMNTNTLLDLEPQDHVRIQKWKPAINLKPMREEGDHILVFPPTWASARIYGVSSDWRQFIARKIREYTNRPIIFREKDEQEPLDSQLEGCHATVGLNSTACVKSVLAGVPTFVPDFSPAAPVASRAMKDLENPFIPHDVLRNRWVDSLLATQFTISEIDMGVALKTILRLYKVSQ